jgi:tetratricopeptide (TPR) repeat protein
MCLFSKKHIIFSLNLWSIDMLDCYIQQGRIYYSSNQYQKAIEYLNTAIVLDSKYPVANGDNIKNTMRYKRHGSAGGKA